MKKIFIMAVITAIMLGAYAQQKDEKADKKACTKNEQKCELKDHVCTAACKDGKHVYVKGEKGYVCPDANKVKK
jgi:hypothetical protein